MTKPSLPPPPANHFTTAAGMLPKPHAPTTVRCSTCGAPGADKCERCSTVEALLDGYASTIVGRAKLMHAVHRAEEALGRRTKRSSRHPPPAETVADEKHIVRRTTKGGP
jgi:hypothetical protein